MMAFALPSRSPETTNDDIRTVSLVEPLRLAGDSSKSRTALPPAITLTLAVEVA
jgi:hypothetical protein